MRVRLHNLFARLSRTAAWPIAFLCVWMGTGGVLHHTDEGPDFVSASSRAALGHVTLAAPADDCAACQWTQGLQSGTFSVCRVVLPLTFAPPYTRRVSRLSARRPLRLRSPRAPPAILS